MIRSDQEAAQEDGQSRGCTRRGPRVNPPGPSCHYGNSFFLGGERGGGVQELGVFRARFLTGPGFFFLKGLAKVGL